MAMVVQGLRYVYVIQMAALMCHIPMAARSCPAAPALRVPLCPPESNAVYMEAGKLLAMKLEEFAHLCE